MSGGYGGDAMSGGDHGPRARSGPRGFYLIAGSALAIGATAALILTDNPRLLKVAVIVAVWACVLALLAGARAPRRYDDDDEEFSSEREAELRHTYQLELDREVAARREYELRLEVAMRRELEDTLRQDIGELRSQVGSLRKELTDRWNGELRLERFALRAESTRLSSTDRQMLEHEAQRLSLEGGSSQEAAYLKGMAQIEHGTSTYRAIRTTTVGGVTTEASTEHHEYVSGESPVVGPLSAGPFSTGPVAAGPREIGPAAAPREVEARPDAGSTRAREVESGPMGRGRGQERPQSGRPPSGRTARNTDVADSASGRYPSPFPAVPRPGSADRPFGSSGELAAGGAAQSPRADRSTGGTSAPGQAGEQPAVGAGSLPRADRAADPLFGPLPAEPAGGSSWASAVAHDDAVSGRWAAYDAPAGASNVQGSGDDLESPARRRRRAADDNDRLSGDAWRTQDSAGWGTSGFRVNGLDHINVDSSPLGSSGFNGPSFGSNGFGASSFGAGSFGADSFGAGSNAADSLGAGSNAAGSNGAGSNAAGSNGAGSGASDPSGLRANSYGGGGATGATPSWGGEPAPEPTPPASSGPAGGWAGLAERDATGRQGRAEPQGDDSGTMRRRRRYREDNEENDVLTRMRQQR